MKCEKDLYSIINQNLEYLLTKIKWQNSNVNGIEESFFLADAYKGDKGSHRLVPLAAVNPLSGFLHLGLGHIFHISTTVLNIPWILSHFHPSAFSTTESCWCWGPQSLLMSELVIISFYKLWLTLKIHVCWQSNFILYNLSLHIQHVQSCPLKALHS